MSKGVLTTKLLEEIYEKVKDAPQSEFIEVNIGELIGRIEKQTAQAVIAEIRDYVLADIPQGNDGSEYANGYYHAMDYVEIGILKLTQKYLAEPKEKEKNDR